MASGKSDERERDASAGKEQKRRPQEGQTRRKKRASRLAKIITGFVAVSLTATEALMFIMFGRTAPVSREAFGLKAVAARCGYDWKEFDFDSNGNILKAFCVTPKNPRALVVMVHGVRSSSDVFDEAAERLLADGYAIMSFDGTASGRSQGKRTMGLQQQRYDLQALLEHTEDFASVRDLPLILFGHSAGAYGVASLLPETRAAAAVCVSGFESPLGTMRYWSQKYAGVLSTIEFPFLQLREYSVKGNKADVSASRAILSANVPVFVAHGAADEVIPIGISIYGALDGASSPLVKRVRTDDARFGGHSNILSDGGVANRDLLDEILEFLDPLTARVAPSAGVTE